MERPAGGNIVLVGMRASGKSSLGRLLAARLQRPFVDLDDELARRAGQDVDSLLAREGSSAFRRREAEVLRWAATLAEHVIATGGGAVLHGAPWEELAARSTVVYLQLPLARLVERARARPRPPLTAMPLEEEVARLLAEREPLYLRADLVVPVDGPDPILALVPRLSQQLADDRASPR